jgi:hypothetical protein
MEEEQEVKQLLMKEVIIAILKCMVLIEKAKPNYKLREIVKIAKNRSRKEAINIDLMPNKHFRVKKYRNSKEETMRPH